MDQSYLTYLKSLPKKRMAAGILARNQAGHVLIVKPTYRDGWGIPGGVVDLNESPAQAAVREFREELGLILREPLKLVCIEYQRPLPGRTESLQFLFAAPVITQPQIERIVLQEAEIEQAIFLPPDEAITLLGPSLGRRIQRGLEGLCGDCVYAEVA